MATKKIQDLENIEEVLPDSIIPVGEATKTKSMLVSQLKKWLSNFFVDKTSDEEIDGYKRFKKYISVINNVFIDDNDVVKGRTPSITKYFSCSFSDNKKSGLEKDRFGGIAGVLGADGNIRADLRCYKNVSDSVEHVRLSVGYDVHGNPISFAPASTAINSIVTTTGISKAQNGYVKLGNGVIIQWGKARVNNGTNITLPTPFSNTNYTVCVTKDVTGAINASDGTGVRPVVGSKVVSTTQFTAYNIWTSADSTYNATISWLAIGY